MPIKESITGHNKNQYLKIYRADFVERSMEHTLLLILFEEKFLKKDYVRNHVPISFIMQSKVLNVSSNHSFAMFKYDFSLRVGK